ncbi:hypothetical protein V1L54_24060 [Streptomyces sp. TRM 70361]|uniref:hypothetical protein n=1 Tax=Streptomyces sp. TRM 70361 TaxID=3116553 RepID=UPI002E7B3255|nr:hypothetical protein [Streptomyces sp. TRM 70361]MEE1942438.1 hypothetical protein [Streptomyces sp. TRM 70361]
MSARLRAIAKETEEIVGRGHYTAPGGREVSIAAAVADAFRTRLTGGGRFAGRFAHVVFAVLDHRPGAPVRAAFERAFADEAGRP